MEAAGLSHGGSAGLGRDSQRPHCAQERVVGVTLRGPGTTPLCPSSSIPRCHLCCSPPALTTVRWAPGRSLSPHFFRIAFKQSLVQKPGCLPTRASHSCSLSLSTWSLLRGMLTGHLPQGEWEEDVFGIPSLDELFTLIFQSEEDKQLQDELEMLVERLGVSHDMLT